MRVKAKVIVGVIVALGVVLVGSPSAHAGVGETFDFKNGKWRLELAGFAALRSGNHSRTGDVGSAISVEYEVPLSSHVSFGLKGYPLFVYDQDDAGEDTVVGVAFGPEFRFYVEEDTYRGFFFEIGVAGLAASGKFDGNTAAVNFLIDSGVGYRFESDWHVSAKFSHISNGGLADHNSGVNIVGIGFGYTF